MRRTTVTQPYKKTINLRAVQLPLFEFHDIALQLFQSRL
jgi:hypothetical protein